MVESDDLAVAPGSAGGRAFDNELIAELRTRAPPRCPSYWTWLTLRHEPSRAVRTAAVAAWALPVVTVTAIALHRGTMPERPRPTLLRPAAALQGLVALRHLTRR